MNDISQSDTMPYAHDNRDEMVQSKTNGLSEIHLVLFHLYGIQESKGLNEETKETDLSGNVNHAE